MMNQFLKSTVCKVEMLKQALYDNDTRREKNLWKWLDVKESLSIQGLKGLANV